MHHEIAAPWLDKEVLQQERMRSERNLDQVFSKRLNAEAQLSIEALAGPRSPWPARMACSLTVTASASPISARSADAMISFLRLQPLLGQRNGTRQVRPATFGGARALSRFLSTA
jgi:hypothetical protein